MVRLQHLIFNDECKTYLLSLLDDRTHEVSLIGSVLKRIPLWADGRRLKTGERIHGIRRRTLVVRRIHFVFCFLCFIAVWLAMLPLGY